MERKWSIKNMYSPTHAKFQIPSQQFTSYVTLNKILNFSEFSSEDKCKTDTRSTSPGCYREDYRRVINAPGSNPGIVQLLVKCQSPTPQQASTLPCGSVLLPLNILRYLCGIWGKTEYQKTPKPFFP